jgi:hypothetical protein
MIPVETAVRAWLEPANAARRQTRKRIAWRSIPFGERVLVFDTETTTDWTQRLLYGFFRIYVASELQQEGIFTADDLSDAQLDVVQRFGRDHGIPVYTREHFVDEIFYPEIYGLGALCVGFNLPFDLTRIAVRAGPARGANGRKFSVQLSRRVRWPRLHIESASARAAFIQFTYKKHLANWEKPFFKGRFLDLSTAASAFTGQVLTLARACEKFNTAASKSSTEDLGRITDNALAYGRRDVLITWQLYERLLAEYCCHPFHTLANEREQPPHSVPITRIYSAASVAKAYLGTMRLRPFLEKQPHFSRRLLGYAAAAYFGGRAEVRLRRVQVPVTVLDFTSMYPTVFLLQDLQHLLAARLIRSRNVTKRIRALVEKATLDSLYDRSMWEQFRVLVRLRPNGDVVPVRMRLADSESFTIAVAPFTGANSSWYTLADVLAAKILGGGKIPHVEQAVEFYPDEPDDKMEPAMLRGAIPLDPYGAMFKTIVEQRQLAKKRSAIDPEANRLDMALKIMANSGAYGIFAEVNVATTKPKPRMVYSDTEFKAQTVRDEKPGRYCNPIVASFVTGAARLLLAMLEAEVTRRGGTFAFCDTDSLAIVSARSNDRSIPWIAPKQIDAIIARFNSLNPYDGSIVPNILKKEHENVLCWPISAKRYCLYTIGSGGAISIVKASESGLGAIMGRTRNETTRKLARRIWTAILYRELGIRFKSLRRSRIRRVLSFDVPLRRKLPLNQPNVLNRDALRRYNASRSYAHRLKPFNFVQVLTPNINVGSRDILPLAPFERDLAKARRLPWIDVHSGRAIAIDWANAGYAGTLGIVTLAEYIERYAEHPENKAADNDGRPADATYRGMLYRLHLYAARRSHIGKEVNRLDEDAGTALEAGNVETYTPRERHGLESAIAAIATRRPADVAAELGVSERRLRDILKRRAIPRRALRQRIERLGNGLGS